MSSKAFFFHKRDSQALFPSWEKRNHIFLVIGNNSIFCLTLFLCQEDMSAMAVETQKCRVTVDPEEKRMPRNVIPFQLLAAITTKLYSHTLLLHKISSVHIYKEINTVHLLEGSFIVRCNGKWCWTFPYVALKQFSSFSKTQRLVRFFSVKSINESLLLVRA